jgi:hypothetical protein
MVVLSLYCRTEIVILFEASEQTLLNIDLNT